MTEGEVKSALKKDGFVLGRVSWEHSDKVAAGRVISQSPDYIEGRENNALKGTKFNLVLSLGPEVKTTPASTPRETGENAETLPPSVDINDIW